MMGSRRSFIRSIGAGVSAAVASTAGMAGAGRTGAGNTDDPTQRAARLEQEQALRRLHRDFERAMDGGEHEKALGMFAEDAGVVFNGGIFNGRDRGVSRLFHNHFRPGKTGGRMQPAPGFEPDAGQQPDVVQVSQDLLSATAVFPCSIQVGAPIDSATSLADMARLHGEGVRTWWEGGVYRVIYRRSAVDGQWMIGRLEYDMLARADYRSGRTYAQPISVARFATRFPGDPHGPDELA